MKKVNPNDDHGTYIHKVNYNAHIRKDDNVLNKVKSMQSLSLENRYIEKTTQQETLLNPFMRVSYIGITSAFQADEAGSIPATRSSLYLFIPLSDAKLLYLESLDTYYFLLFFPLFGTLQGCNDDQDIK